jgi:hypothetical protein
MVFHRHDGGGDRVLAERIRQASVVLGDRHALTAEREMP